jgi:hypothetical protein
MAKLFLRGVAKPIVIDKSTAITLNKIKDNKDIPKDHEFNKNGLRFSKGDIRYIFENDQEDDSQDSSDNRKQENDEYYNKATADYKHHIENLCKKDVKAKAEDIKLFSILYFSVNGKNPDDKLASEVIGMQRAYFDKNPRHPYARVNYFKLIDNYPKENKEYYDMKVGVAHFGVRFTERVIVEAFREAQFQRLF